MRGILYRYGRFFPLNEQRLLPLTLGEGATPLIPLRRLGKTLEIDLWAKFEGCNPTGSFKDRGMVLAVTKALEDKARAIVCASTGNTSASAAAYAALAGIPCYVLLPAGKVAMGKLVQALMYGAKVLAVRGNFDRALELAQKAAKEKGFCLVNSVNRYRLWGQRSAAWEICDELGNAPEWLAIPVGNAGNITAYWAGFIQYRRMGRSSRIPKMVGFQASKAAPFVTGSFIDNPETVATAIRIGHPVNAKKARAAVASSGGSFHAVDDAEILEAQKRLASEEGFFAEPASCAPIAGLFSLKKRGLLPAKTRVVAVLTGNGLKDPDTALGQVPQPVEVEGEWDALEEALSS